MAAYVTENKLQLLQLEIMLRLWEHMRRPVEAAAAQKLYLERKHVQLVLKYPFLEIK